MAACFAAVVEEAASVSVSALASVAARRIVSAKPCAASFADEAPAYLWKHPTAKGLQTYAASAAGDATACGRQMTRISSSASGLPKTGPFDGPCADTIPQLADPLSAAKVGIGGTAACPFSQAARLLVGASRCSF